MTRTTISRPRMAAIYAPRHGTRPPLARRWRRARLPSAQGWTACADLTDIHPITGRALRVLCGGSSRRRNNRDQHRAQAVPSWARCFKSGRGSGRARVEAKQPENITPPPSLPLWRRRIC